MEKDILEEDYLSAEFKFGFELEAIYKNGYMNNNSNEDEDEDDNDEDDDYELNDDGDEPDFDNDEDYYKWLNSDEDDNSDNRLSDKQVKKNLTKLLSDAFKINPNDIDIKDDGSVKSKNYLKFEKACKEMIYELYVNDPSNNTDEMSEEEIERIVDNIFEGDYDYYEDEYRKPDYDYPFEWAVPVMQFTPTNIQKCINGLKKVTTPGEDYIYTNDSCGFHTHLSFPNISDKDFIWVISKLAVDKEMKSQILKFKGIKFYAEPYASKSWLDGLTKSIESKEYYHIKHLFDTTKYRNIRAHPQGTIEWRGPRKFTEYNSYIADYFKFLYTFVRWIARTQQENEINGMSKDEYFKKVYDNTKENDMIPDFNENKALKSISEKIYKDFNSPNSSLLAYVMQSKGQEKALQVIDTLQKEKNIYTSDILNYINKNISYAINHKMKAIPYKLYKLMEYRYGISYNNLESISEKNLEAIIQDMIEYDIIDMEIVDIMKCIWHKYEKGKDTKHFNLFIKYFHYMSEKDITTFLNMNPIALNYVYKNIEPESIHASIFVSYIMDLLNGYITANDLFKICQYNPYYAKNFYTILISLLNKDNNDEMKQKMKNLLAKVSNMI